MATDIEIRVEFEYIKTLVPLWRKYLADFAKEAAEHTKNLAVTTNSGRDFRYLVEMRKLNDEVQAFVRGRAFEAMMVFYGFAETLEMIEAYYAFGSEEYARQLRATSGHR